MSHYLNSHNVYSILSLVFIVCRSGHVRRAWSRLLCGRDRGGPLLPGNNCCLPHHQVSLHSVIATKSYLKWLWVTIVSVCDASLDRMPPVYRVAYSS